MQVVASSRWLRSEVFPSVDVSGREHLVIVTKGAWSLPQAGQRPRPVEPSPIAWSDEHYGEPGLSAVRYPSDAVRFKPSCDVLFDARAHAPDGKAVPALMVEARVAGMTKRLKVWGRRRWQRFLMTYEASAPEPFTSMPLHFGMAFGGTHNRALANGEVDAEVFDDNPVGLGWAGPRTIGHAKDQPMPCLESLERPVRSPEDTAPACALSALPVHHPSRQRHAGTYDAAWRRDVFPFLPEDFNDLFHQSAPEDQRIPYPVGGEEVALTHMQEGQPHLRFTLPPLDQLQIRVLRKDYGIEQPRAQVDTLFFETEARRMTAVWRASVPIRRRIQEFDTIAIGPVDEAWWRARSLGLEDAHCAGCGPAMGAQP